MMIRRIILVAATGLLLLPSVGFAKKGGTPASPTTSPAEWFPQNSYPPEAKRLGAQGRVAIELTVSTTGVPTACKVLSSSGSPVLDGATCDLAMTNGRFTPAKDSRGRPIETSYTIPGVRWELSMPTPRPLEGPWRDAATFQIGRSGELSGCNEQRTGPVPADLQLCQMSKATPPAFGLYARGGSTDESVEFVFEMSLGFDDAPAPALVYESGNREIVRMHIIHFMVDTDGKPKNCQVEAQSGADQGNACDQKPAQFIPIDKPRGVTVKLAMSRPAALVAPGKP